MTLLRGQLLTTGPLALIAACYLIAAPTSVPGNRIEQLIPRIEANFSATSLNAECRIAADHLGEQVPANWKIVIHSPFVIAGDFPANDLDRFHRDTISPTTRALAIQFFDHEPTWPICIVLCSSDDSYRECCRRLGERNRSEYSGIYSRSTHRAVVNIATGEGTLAHELTHALAHADFPDLPEWLDEGLASLYEECEFSGDGQRLTGLENWRGSVLRNYISTKDLRTISAMIAKPFASDDPSIEYAQVRYFCLYLQKRNLLEPFYRKCRCRTKANRDELKTLAELTGSTDLRAIDTQFQAWLRGLKAER